MAAVDVHLHRASFIGIAGKQLRKIFGFRAQLTDAVRRHVLHHQGHPLPLQDGIHAVNRRKEPLHAPVLPVRKKIHMQHHFALTQPCAVIAQPVKPGQKRSQRQISPFHPGMARQCQIARPRGAGNRVQLIRGHIGLARVASAKQLQPVKAGVRRNRYAGEPIRLLRHVGRGHVQCKFFHMVYFFLFYTITP